METITQKEAPFQMQVKGAVAEILYKLKISLALSTYQAGKMVLLSATSPDRMVQLPRTFQAPMGVAYHKGRMAIACKNEVIHLVNTPQLIGANPKFKGKYDAMFVPRQQYITGSLALHDMAYTNKGLVAVNTQFSCLCAFDGLNSFTPIWKPGFITELRPEDRCHLNGLAVDNGMPKYVTSLGKSDEKGGWRENKLNGGLLMELPSGNILCDGLSMPHSPRLINGKLLVLNSAQGELLEIDRETGEKKVLLSTGTFLRGMAQYGDFLFIGGSKLRHKTEAFRGLPIADTSFAGIIVVQLSSMTEIGRMQYLSSVDETYDVVVIPNIHRPGILNYAQAEVPQPIINNSDAYWAEAEKEK